MAKTRKKNVSGYSEGGNTASHIINTSNMKASSSLKQSHGKTMGTFEENEITKLETTITDSELTCSDRTGILSNSVGNSVQGIVIDHSSDEESEYSENEKDDLGDVSISNMDNMCHEQRMDQVDSSGGIIEENSAHDSPLPENQLCIPRFSNPNYVQPLPPNAFIDASAAVPTANISRFKNKQKRREAFEKLKLQKLKERKKLRKKKQKERELLGDKAPPKQIPKTLENTREKDLTTVRADDHEVFADEAADELSSYFKREYVPKIFITTSDRPHGNTNRFVRELLMIIPNSSYRHRKHIALKKLIPRLLEKEFTDLIVVNHDQDTPNGLIICHLPDGPTAHFKLSSVKFSKDIKRRTHSSDHRPELVLNNFTTRLGHSVGRMIASLFPHDPEFSGRRVVTFHNQRDFLFFRHHRYEFKTGEKCRLQEIGPRFTLKLRSLQKGAFDTKFGEYEWVHKRHEMETSRRRFFL